MKQTALAQKFCQFPHAHHIFAYLWFWVTGFGKWWEVLSVFAYQMQAASDLSVFAAKMLLENVHADLHPKIKM